jgi:predicted DNA-binding transcriptional regulator AlpA
MQLEQHEIDKIADAISKKIAEKLLPHLQLQPQDEFLTIEDAAKLIRKSNQQIYQWVNKSKHGLSDFPFSKAGKSLIFSRNELIRWMRKHGKSLEH